MELQNFIVNFANQFEETDASFFTKECVFKEQEEWSSLIALSIIAMVDEEYEVVLKGEDIRTANTIEDLFDIIKNKK